MVSSPKGYTTVDQQLVRREDIDVLSRYITMGSLHRAHAVSGAMALAAAAKINGTIPNQIISSSLDGIRIGHPSGTLYAAAAVEKSGEEWNVVRAANGRTARRLMEGYSYVPTSIFAGKQHAINAW